MLPYVDKAALARTADSKELWQCVKDSSTDVVLNTISNKNLTEDMVIFIAVRKNTSSEVLGILAADARFRGSYKHKLAICKNPKTPAKITLPLLKFLRISDLADITKNQNIARTIRQKVEYPLLEKMASLPLGVKIALSKGQASTSLSRSLKKAIRVWSRPAWKVPF